MEKGKVGNFQKGKGPLLEKKRCACLSKKKKQGSYQT